jgi:hypothetical protein
MHLAPDHGRGAGDRGRFALMLMTTACVPRIDV